MSKVQLAVGQVWKDRVGREITVADNPKYPDESDYPFKDADGPLTFLSNGRWCKDYVDSDLIELVQDENGWRPWKATADSQCPVADGTRIIYRLANRKEAPAFAGDKTWDTACDIEIVAYKIVEEAPKAEDPPAQQPAADGWIPYAGGGCPVDGDVTVEVRLRSGQEHVEAADYWDWSIDDVGRDIVAYRVVEKTPKAVEPPARRHSHYFKDVSQIDEIDVYRICDLFEVDDSSGATQHAIKKLLCAGKRGAKDRSKDYREAIDTLNRRLAMWEGE